ncbi:MAG: iron-containing alcohol dehydrogenase [Thermoleophilaceae bacterium]
MEGRPVVALGGGRVVDAGKAIAAADGLRTASIPTTLAGSPFTPFHRMPAGVEGYGLVRPALVVADPRLMASMPEEALAATAMNALAHATEALYAPGANPVTEGAALRAAGLFAQGLAPGALDRSALALAAVLGGYAVGVAGLAIHHAVCQTVVRVAGTPHAQTNAVVLPHSVAFAATRVPEVIGRLAKALGGGTEDPALAPAAVALMSARTGVHTLAELGLAESQLDELADATAAHPGLANTPGGADRDDVRALLQSALR